MSIQHSVADGQWSELQRLHEEMTDRFDEHTLVSVSLGLPSDHPKDQERCPSIIYVWINEAETDIQEKDFYDFSKLAETFDLYMSSKPTRDKAAKTLRDLADAIERAGVDSEVPEYFS